MALALGLDSKRGLDMGRNLLKKFEEKWMKELRLKKCWKSDFRCLKTSGLWRYKILANVSPVITWKIEKVPDDLVDLAKYNYKQNFNGVNLLLLTMYKI